MEVSIQDVSKKIKGSLVLEHITLSMKSGKIYGLQGINGSGKTMLMRAICGLILPDSGSIQIDGKRLGKEISFPESVGLLLENPSFLAGYTALENLQLIAAVRNVADNNMLREAITKVGLNPEDKRKYKKFSLGMKQRLGIACAIMENPQLILLDEPFNALDEEGVELARNIILEQKDKGKLVVLSCHDRGQLENLSDYIVRMKSGQICEVIDCEKASSIENKT